MSLSATLLVFSFGAIGDVPKEVQDPAKQVIKVAIYDHNGPGPNTNRRKRIVPPHPQIKVSTVNASEIQQDRLRDYDVVVFAAGSGLQQGRALEEKGRLKVKTFVEEGGGYVGIAAGAYLATAEYITYLGIMNARLVDVEHWQRGCGNVEVVMSKTAQEVFGIGKRSITMLYANGPLLKPGPDLNMSAYETWGVFDTEIAEDGAPLGVMKGTPAIAASKLGKGRILWFSASPELLEETKVLLTRGILWASGD